MKVFTMKPFLRHCLLICCISSSLQTYADFMNQLPGFVIGAAVAGGGTAWYMNQTRKTEPAYHYQQLKTTFGNLKHHYGSVLHNRKTQGNDSIIKDMGQWCINNKTNRYQLKKLLDSEIQTLRSQIAEVSADALESSQPLDNLYKEAKKFLQELENYAQAFDETSPFIELWIQNNQKELLEETYSNTLTSNAPFSRMKTVQKMETDSSTIASLLQQARISQKNSNFQKNLVNALEEFKKSLDKKRQEITNTNPYKQERKDWDNHEITKKRLEVDWINARNEAHAIEIKQEQNRLDREKLCHAKEKLAIEKAKIQQGEALEQLKWHYEQQITSLTLQLSQLEADNITMQTNYGAVQKIIQEIEKEISTPSHNPEHKEWRKLLLEILGSKKKIVEDRE